MMLGLRGLPPYDPERDPNGAALATALALYFDHIFFLEIVDLTDIPNPEAFTTTIDRLNERFDERFAKDRLLERASARGVPITWREQLTIDFARELLEKISFYDQYEPLINASVFIRSTVGERQSSPGKVSDGEFLDAMFRVFSGSSAGWSDNAAALLAVDGLNATMPDDMASTIFLFGDWLSRQSLDRFREWNVAIDSAERNVFAVGYLTGMLFSIFVRSVIADLTHRPVIAFYELHARLRHVLLEAVAPLRTQRSSHEEATHLVANDLVNHALMRLPSIIPRSTSAILEVRELLHEPLTEFRSRAKRIAEHMVLDLKLTEQDIASAAARELTEPLEDLKARLAKPSRMLARNLLSNTAILSTGVTLLASVAWKTPGALSAALPLMSAILASTAKTWVDRKDAIDTSGVSFLLRMESLTTRRSA